MKTIKFNLNIEAADCYLYSGHLFLILNDGSIGCLNLNKIYHNLYVQYPEYVDFFRLIFQRNDYYKNQQGDYFFKIPELKSSFDKLWRKVSNTLNFEYFINNELIILAKIPESDLPVLDIKIYGMKIFIATIKGVYSMKLSYNSKYEFQKDKKIKKYFDAKSISLNAKCGALAVSTNMDGLFYGSINDETILQIKEKEVSTKSIRTSWVGYDIINYESNSSFEFLENEIEIRKQENEHSFYDEKKEKNLISNFGKNKITNELLIKNLASEDKEIKYAFNSSKKSFLITDKGKFYTSNFIVENDYDYFLDSLGIKSEEKVLAKEIRISRTSFELPLVKNKKMLKPLSSHIIENGCVLEFIDKIVLFKNNEAEIIDTDPSIILRTYPGSLRYKNILSVSKEDKITIHAIYPF
ncbi:hypothetical protein GON26_14250 [Flavobacterium sp. GA093]|uniref:Uncharacterized protein n=1 Tax=Flavobacterium hydrocarbonoxydans TaxID=2683249 RepID=A0A6I4NMA9_9FLAO|nr:hypothetical protein [Flavobacterium hydrocarbonoxydans]MWB95528.1 hypothetical protein [Flavobacterium hydrocarbonoxydans]